MKRAILAGLAIAALAYVWTHVEPIYGDCTQTIDGKVCTLKGYDWKGRE